MKSDCGNIPIQKNPPEKCVSHFNVASVTPVCCCLRGQSVGTAARKTTLMISCQVEPFSHFSFPTNTECVSTPSQVNCLSERVITSVDDITVPTGEPLNTTKPSLAPPLVKCGHFKTSLSSREWSDLKKNGFQLTRLTEEEVQQYGDLRSALPLFYRLHPLNTLAYTDRTHLPARGAQH